MEFSLETRKDFRMVNVQKQIEQYDDKVRLTRLNENAVLVRRRDAVLEKLRAQFDAKRKEDKKVPTFQPFNQGSYEMGTGIDPDKGDYDIDVGLEFNATTSDYPNPVDLKELVYEALKDHTPLGTSVRRSCVTVKYQVDGEQAYHVDLAVYACTHLAASPRELSLAKGKLHSAPENRSWERSDPKGLTAWVETRFSDAEQQRQFLRVIRCLKGWKSYRFSHEGNSAPAGIGLTIAAGRLFSPVVEVHPVSKKVTCDDRSAMRALVDKMIAGFTLKPSSERAGTFVERLAVMLPVVPATDVMARMTDGQMAEFKLKLIGLRDVLDLVDTEVDPVEACKRMADQFGSRFPVPTKEETGQPRGPAIVSSGSSA